MTAPLGDADARHRITDRLDETLFVEAGAGSGKTKSLVDRVVATVLSGIPLPQVAAVTFTEKAAAELRDRLRVAFEAHAATAAPDARCAGEAVDDLDKAAIGTLHSFAQRILGEHPIEAGLPPLVEILDEVTSGVAFDNRWTTLRADLLDDPELADTLLLAMAAGMRLDDLRALTMAFTANWDLITDRVLAAPGDPPPPVDVDTLLTEAERILVLRAHCRADDDKMLARLEHLADWARQLAAAPDEAARLTVLGLALGGAWRHGRAGNWRPVDLDELRGACRDLATAATSLRDRVLEATLRRLAHRIGRATLDDAAARRAEGRLEFHDLLVLARDLLRHPQHGATVRTSLQQRYRRLLLDEFQDTDPIQVELAVRIAGGADADATDWTDVHVPAGSLFVVGDPKQSIYRFRRADIATYLRARQHLGAPVVLDTNFRTGAPILDWINTTFGTLIVAEPGSQPAYRPLNAVRPTPPTGPPVITLGAQPHGDDPDADELRTREAADVAATIQTILAERWQVSDGDGWRDAGLRDIAVLVPARTSLPHLETALDAAGIGYHSAASSLVYRTREVRDLLTAARAADDPSDALALLTALRTPLFGCGDDDLYTWRRAGGRVHLLAPAPTTLADDHPVGRAIAYLRRLHDDRAWLAPSEVLTRLIDDRRMYEVAAASPHARDIWRRLRFVVDQARAFTDAEHASLRGYLSWAARQASETARVAEAILPETDTDTIRIMTIHAAKGLEFGIVVVSGMTSRAGGARAGVEVLWPRTGGYEVRLRKELQTTAFEAAKPLDEQMGHHERLRLLYVACTRARDHLVVSLHRKTRTAPRTPGGFTSAELLADAAPPAPDLTPTTTADGHRPTPPAVTPPPPYDQWHDRISQAQTAAARPSAVSASHLEGTHTTVRPAEADRLGEPRDPGLAKNPRDLELPPWNKGRYGTAIGRAVHGVLQSVDLATGSGLQDAVAAQALAEGVADHTELVTQLAHAALDSDVVQQAATRPHWRETYVGTTLGDRILEGIIDLLYRDDDGLVIVDYKTDAVPTAAFDARIDYYRPQMAAYATAVHVATGETVARCILLFLTPYGAHPQPVTDLAEAAAQIRHTVQYESAMTS
ncbi:UvrD-helicase domain-containing protein [Couchioplanes caeruleus]|uniref:DNA 3'-5' helicase n=2 Tax=Couchioplanes caeruleus TaxID=56438 RepID=A0A1K0GXQ9_9ACTN|nr:UvrD-helicase domain-containing protein [Couchioplanes caeruleus]OJF14219.1 hypothetical protein BG844_10915 [Couchioplanes caeruleus subsp. caeruleus]ROP31048.1 ATP-dependent exoDNAse (exonuclease V) beta subunit [Couchioplanes caeruleus]